MLERDILRDPMTKLKSYYQFIEEDFKGLFGTAGFFILFDMAEFAVFNQKYGKDEGDRVLVKVSMILKRAINPVHIYRMEGDAFLVVLSGVDKLSVGIIKKRIMQHFSELQAEYLEGEISLNYALYEYKEPIKSLAEYYSIILSEESCQYSDKFKSKRLIEHIVIGVTNRLKESVSYYNDICKFAVMDDMTKLSNSKAAKNYLSRMRLHQPFAIAFIDGDGLSKFNAISYDMGNDVIAHLAQVIQSSVRVDDHVFRWLSGDEFLIVFHGVTYEQSLALSERVRSNIEKSGSYKVTASLGLVHYPTDDDSVEGLLKKAEKANRAAKRLGKNRVVSWSQVVEEEQTYVEIT
ncbi:MULTISPECIES: diguanylate cyclase domain-containing protein [unclassified Fusibacter]|uniref:GGDEF domain-containing protein n=1 Tax=unclassified Fusibacter TaxID=2624464 RepID=UPI0013E97D04|nr:MULTISPECIES: diguanylate cyclase [unclassified Fusibacter]MCK8060480.1 diguanylate cyclase [Fusibacter sp. A2]NPE20231.1 diguanylate cyclase [Fusibacter sp. A1]